MRVLMLGWEFPPYITGGLGTACNGLTRGLSRQGVDVLFVLPRAVGRQHPQHVQLLSPADLMRPRTVVNGSGVIGGSDAAPMGTRDTAAEPRGTDLANGATRDESMGNVEFRAIPSAITSPYLGSLARTPEEVRVRGRRIITTGTSPEQRAAYDRAEALTTNRPAASAAPAAGYNEPDVPPTAGDYSGDVVAESQRYAEVCLELVRDERFDVIHAHDWMTYPAGLAVAAATGKPLVVHVHSTEFDRSGEHPYQPIYDIERRGMHGAMTVVCVSHLTKKICVARYGVPSAKVHVVYNGIESDDAQPATPTSRIERGDKIVLFLGRITMQKGPEYFVEAAKKVLSKIDRVKFVMAGAGDMVPQIMQMAREMGIAHKVLFTGFLRGRDVARVFELADVYVMPSVSEPFGIAPLEAIRHDVPVIISRSSGVSEVIRHALKVDFWNTDDIADKIIAVLRHPPLGDTLRQHADLEVRSLTWDGAATKCVQVYKQSIDAMRSGAAHVSVAPSN
ncbi:MAG: glycosyltransferase [Phycisphaera sp.]|nr:glycosyltransferase [Phycisphaera sp.]